MLRIVARRRVLSPLALIGAIGAAGALLAPRLARAFTIPNLAFAYDPVGLGLDQTLHVNVVNQFSGNTVLIRSVVTPTTPGAGSQVVGANLSVGPGHGSDEAFAFA